MPRSKQPTLQTMQENRIRWFEKPYPLKSTRSREERTKGRKSRGIYYTDCIYYYWFEYLKLSEKYKTACEGDGKGMKRIYADFGNVFDIDFMDWWEEKDKQGDDRGARLFGDTKITKMESFISLKEANGLKSDINSGRYKLLAVPTGATKAELNRAFSFLLRDLKVTEDKRTSNAKYRIQNVRVTADVLKKSFKAWNLKHTENYTNLVIGAILGGKESADTISALKRNMGKRMNTDKRILDFDICNYYSLAASRALKRAEANIKAAEKGLFPVSKIEELKDS